jgi:hypothetical protein
MATMLCLAFAANLQAAELTIEARLIWGTNSEKISDPNCKAVDKALAAKMKKVFSWKNYFEVNRQTAIVPSRGNQQIKLSSQCTIDIKELEGANVEVTLIGEGKPVNKTTYPLSKGESFTIAGDGKDGSAWFILITELNEK